MGHGGASPSAAWRTGLLTSAETTKAKDLMKKGKIYTQNVEVSVEESPVASCPSHQVKQLLFQKIHFTLHSKAKSGQQSAD